MSGRDSDSKRRHSRHDREASPKRYRRDEKEERDERKHVPRHSNQQAETVNKDAAAAANKKSNEPPKHSSQSTQPPRSRSYHQHDERSSTGHVGRSAGRREAGGKVFTQNREHNERVETDQSRELRDEKSQAKLDDSFKRRDSFTERKDDPPSTTRKRPAFREKKIPVDSGDANPAATVAVKSSNADHPPERNERKEKRSSNPCHLDRPARKFAEDRAPYKSETRREGFSSRVRDGGGGGNSVYRGRDKFNGRQGYHLIKTRTEKWTHDLYQEVNKDPIPKSVDDQIAKLEALLAS